MFDLRSIRLIGLTCGDLASSASSADLDRAYADHVHRRDDSDVCLRNIGS